MIERAFLLMTDEPPALEKAFFIVGMLPKPPGTALPPLPVAPPGRTDSLSELAS